MSIDCFPWSAHSPPNVTERGWRRAGLVPGSSPGLAPVPKASVPMTGRCREHAHHRPRRTRPRRSRRRRTGTDATADAPDRLVRSQHKRGGPCPEMPAPRALDITDLNGHPSATRLPAICSSAVPRLWRSYRARRRQRGRRSRAPRRGRPEGPVQRWGVACLMGGAGGRSELGSRERGRSHRRCPCRGGMSSCRAWDHRVATLRASRRTL